MGVGKTLKARFGRPCFGSSRFACPRFGRPRFSVLVFACFSFELS